MIKFLLDEETGFLLLACIGSSLSTGQWRAHARARLTTHTMMKRRLPRAISNSCHQTSVGRSPVKRLFVFLVAFVARREPHMLAVCGFLVHRTSYYRGESLIANRDRQERRQQYPMISDPIRQIPSRNGARGSSSMIVGSLTLSASAPNDPDDDEPKASSRQMKKSKTNKKKTDSKQRTQKPRTKNPKHADPAKQKKQEIMQQIKSKMEEKSKTTNSSNNGNSSNNQKKKSSGNALGKLINPFQAGKELRETLGSLSTLGLGLSEETKQKYYLDDRFLDSSGGVSGSGTGPRSSASGILSSFSASSFLQDALNAPSYVPEVLVIGATGEIGRLVVRRLLLEGRFQVRVLVRDLYSQTLNLLGTGVSYCQGDLNNVESLEYALTDVDKIVYVAGAPRPDEKDFQIKFQRYIQEHNLKLNGDNEDDSVEPQTTAENLQWEQLTSVLEVRAELAEQVDFVGMQNLVSAYQNVRHADYGTSQAAKRSLFKFASRPGDFDLFALDDNYGIGISPPTAPHDDEATGVSGYEYVDPYIDEEEDDDSYEYQDYEDDNSVILESRAGIDVSAKTQVQWIRNQFGNGVFVGRVPSATSANVAGGEAAIVSSRLRSRDDPVQGIDLRNGFAGFILRLVSDGNKFEAFVRTGSFETDGIEYICEFSTDTKRTSLENKSRNRFKTLRLAFENFKPVQRQSQEGEGEGSAAVVAPFMGNDVRYIGFRFRSSSNLSGGERLKQNLFDSFQSFYLALSYIKVYRIQPEPEFVYLSDGRIPPIIRNGMVQHEQRVLLTDLNAAEVVEEDADTLTTTLFDEKTLQAISQMDRSPAETYFKYRGEEILKKSGLSYTIIRVAGFNELPTSDASTIDLVQTNKNLVPVSRSEVAQVCVSALMEPSALNKSVYMTKKKSVSNVWDEENISAKFEAITNDKV
jgi:hypothetical protein